jgi:NAD(P)-dependent dehydrogenase (short-subunit alcohol dehydrogenase family)
MNFAGRVAMVTGANSGSGIAICERLLSSGCSVFMTFHRSRSSSLDCLQADPNASICPLDVTSVASVDHSFGRLREKFGRLDYLVNIASFSRTELWDIDPMKIELSDWNAALDVDVTGSFLCAQRAIPLMLEAGGGKIINFGSSGSMRGDANTFAYNTAKVALVGLTKSIARAYAPNIIANLIAPGSIDTGWVDRWNLKAEEIANVHALRDMPRRQGTPQELAELTLFLLSEKCSYLNGQTVYFDGGLST